MELSNIIEILWRRKWVIIVTMLIATSVAVGLVMTIPDQYRVTALLRVLTPGENGWANTDYADRLNNTYPRVINSDRVMDPLMEQLSLDSPPSVGLRAIPNTELLELSMEGRDAEIVNTLAALLVENNREFYFGQISDSAIAVREELDMAIDQLTALYNRYDLLGDNPIERSELELEQRVILETAETRVENLQTRFDEIVLAEEVQADSIYIMQEAKVPTSPYGPNRTLMIILAVMVSGLGSIGMAFVFENLDNKLYTSKQIQVITKSLPLAHIPKSRELRRHVQKGTRSVAIENFRTLRTNLFALIGMEHQNKIILISSADPKEGKSTVTAFLGSVIAQAGNKVVVIDGDMRLPRQHDLYGLSNERGLSDLLNGDASLEEVLQHNDTLNVDVITGGTLPANAAELLTSDAMENLLETLSQEYDLVLLDSPALTVVADGTQLATMVDGVIVIARRYRTTRNGLQRALDQLDQVGANLLGVVVNHAQKNSMQSYYHAVAKEPSSNRRSGGGTSGPKSSGKETKGQLSSDLPTDDEQLAGGTAT
jgi:capsular exopolysaccharide synthesis family protein